MVDTIKAAGSLVGDGYLIGSKTVSRNKIITSELFVN